MGNLKPAIPMLSSDRIVPKTQVRALKELNRDSARRGELVYGIPVRPRSGCEFAKYGAPSSDDKSRVNQPRPLGVVQICQDSPWRIVSLILLTCCLFLALSGCGGTYLAHQGGTPVLSALFCSSTSMTGSGTD